MKGKTPDDIISEILKSQQRLEVVEKAAYQCHMMNIVKILNKYGESYLAELVQKRLDSQSTRKVKK